MPARILDTIDSPADLRGLSYEQLDQLALELRAEMVATTSIHGGHLAPSLGAVEIIIALHRVLNCPDDHIVFDVGHQAYAHKLLTGRREAFSSLRTEGGISGFPKVCESPYDSHDSGHASDALSVALGYALARDLDGKDNVIAAVVGDASFVGGMSLEALNEIGHSATPVVIVLNDNGMSISRSVGGFATFLGRARMSERYTAIRDQVEEKVNSKGRLGKFLMERGNAAKESFKQFVLPGDTFFEGFGVTYIGPVDGHNIFELETIIRDAVDLGRPVLIHAVTTKGKGFAPAEEHPDTFHGVGPFDLETGAVKKSGAVSWTSVFSDELISMASDHPDIVAITAAMPSGTGLAAFAKEYPARCFDVGIAEESAVGVASALSLGGYVPFVALYSTFMQRAYDQALINVALEGLHVVFCLDRAGLVGEDGPTHHGAFDLAFMRTVPGMQIIAPSCADDLRSALRLAYELEGPVCVRYPRGSVAELEGTDEKLQMGKALVRRDGSDVAILALGSTVKAALDAADILAQSGTQARVVDMRWAKPIDEQAVKDAAACGHVVTVEEGALSGGFGSGVLEVMAQLGVNAKVTRLGLPDAFVGQGTQAQLRKEAGLDAQGIVSACLCSLGLE